MRRLCKRKNSLLLKDFIVNIQEEIFLPGIGDYLEKFGLKDFIFDGNII